MYENFIFKCFILQQKLKSIEKSIPIWEQELFEFDILTSFARFRIENPSSRFVSNEEKLQILNIETWRKYPFYFNLLKNIIFFIFQ